jgi:twitching motility protein PilJ
MVLPSEQIHSSSYSTILSKTLFRLKNLIIAKEERSKIKGLSLNFKATIIAGFLGIFPVIAIGSIAYYLANESIQKQVIIKEQFEAEQLSNQLQIILQSKITDTEIIAKFISDEIEDIELINNSDDTQKQKLLKKISEEIQELKDNYQIYLKISLYDLNGQELEASENIIGKENRNQDTFFQEIVKTKNTIISDPILINTTNYKGYVFATGVPVKNEDNEVIAIVITQMPVNYLIDLIFKKENLQLGKNYHIIDSKDRIIFNISEREEKKQHENNIATYISNWEAIKSKQNSLIWIEEKDIHTYKKIKISKNLEWNILTSFNLNIAFGAQDKLRKTFFIGILLSISLVIIFVILIIKRTIKPIILTTKIVQKFAKGELDLRLQLKNQDELGILGANIDRMAEKIQNLIFQNQKNTETLIHHNELINKLARSEELHLGNFKAAAFGFTEEVAKTLGVERVSVWLYKDTRDAIFCFDLYQTNENRHNAGMELYAKNFPKYFQALTQDVAIIANDALTHDSTRDFTQDYLIPLNIKSMLDVPIRVAGETTGVICCESVGISREWLPQEQSFVSSIANLLALALESELIQSEVNNLLVVACAIEEGDLEIQAEVTPRTTGLVADTLNRTVEKLIKVNTQVLGTAKKISMGANQLQSLGKMVADNAGQQANEANQVLEAIEQVEKLAEYSAQQIDINNQALLDVSFTIEKGKQQIELLTTGIDRLNLGSDSIVQRVKTLGEFVGLAEQFLQEQNQIASMTQVLALNATLVAARASEQKDPRQFMVVAREFEAIATQVSSLAQQTNQGLEALEQRTAQIQSVVSAVDGEVQNLNNLVNSFNEAVQFSERAFQEVQTVTAQVVEVGQEINFSSQEIVTATQTSARAMGDITALAEKTAELTRIARVESEEMDTLSHRLLESIHFFKLPQDTHVFDIDVNLQVVSEGDDDLELDFSMVESNAFFSAS